MRVELTEVVEFFISGNKLKKQETNCKFVALRVRIQFNYFNEI